MTLGINTDFSNTFLLSDSWKTRPPFEITMLTANYWGFALFQERKLVPSEPEVTNEIGDVWKQRNKLVPSRLLTQSVNSLNRKSPQTASTYVEIDERATSPSPCLPFPVATAEKELRSRVLALLPCRSDQ